MSFLSLDEAAQQLHITRKALSGSISTLNLKTVRGDDHRAYLSAFDVERLQDFREGKNNPLYAGSITYAEAPQPKSMPRNYRSYVAEGFKADSTLYKVVNYILINAAAIPPKLYADRTHEKEIEQHPLLDKLEAPNPEQSGVSYREDILGNTLITGNSFQYLIRARKSGPPDELWVLSSEMVKPVLKKPRGIIGYDFEAFADDQNPIDPSLIGHLKSWGPDPIFGQSPIEAGAILIDQNTAARKWNLSCLQNGGRMDGAWVAPTALGFNERQKLEEKLNAKYRGYSNAGKAPVLDAGMVFNPTAYTPTEMDWLEAIRRNSGDIANLYNIPPQLIGDTSATTYNNMKEAKAASYTEAIFPLLDRLYALWTKWLLPLYGLKDASLYYDKNTVEVVQQVIQDQKDALAKRAVAAWLQGAITMNEARELMELPPVDGGDVFRFGAVLVRVSELDDYAEQSLTKPAAPPFPQPEPLNVAPAPGTPGEPGQPTPSNTPQPKPATQQEGAQQGNVKPASGAGAAAAVPAVSGNGKSLDPGVIALRGDLYPERWRPEAGSGAERGSQKAIAHPAEVTHLLWECGTHPCAECAENDGVLIAVDDSFPNGCDAPECHRNCQCQLYELSIPEQHDPSDFSRLMLATLFGIGIIAGSHAGEPNQADLQEQEEGEDTGEEEYAKTIHLEEARERKQRRLRRRKEFQAFTQEATL